jgi:hypothetical protein
MTQNRAAIQAQSAIVPFQARANILGGCAAWRTSSPVAFARLRRLRDNGRRRAAIMAIPQNLFKLLSEFIVLLLGALLILLSISGRIGLPGRPAALIALGIVFIYWGARAGLRKDPKASRAEAKIRASSLALVGIAVLAIPFLSVRYAPLLLSVAGSVLVLRGLLGAVFSLRRA